MCTNQAAAPLCTKLYVPLTRENFSLLSKRCQGGGHSRAGFGCKPWQEDCADALRPDDGEDDAAGGHLHMMTQGEANWLGSGAMGAPS
eukprot:1139515-Pelagomonas_calceolata.AAC.8